MNINYQSDFKIIETMVDVDLTIPFTFTYSSGYKCFIASFDGTTYTNCRRLDDGRLIVAFDDVGFQRYGKLIVKREYFLNDSDFADGICNAISIEDTGIVLVEGKSDSSTVEIEVLPNYLKLTFDDLTNEDIALLQQPALEAASLANTATSNANIATTNANEATILANNSATSANNAAILASQSSILANQSATNADGAASLANTATSNANIATTNANTATSNANLAASLANQAAIDANATLNDLGDYDDRISANENGVSTNKESIENLDINSIDGLDDALALAAGASITVEQSDVPKSILTTESSVNFYTLHSSTNSDIISADDTLNTITFHKIGRYQLLSSINLTSSNSQDIVANFLIKDSDNNLISQRSSTIPRLTSNATVPAVTLSINVISSPYTIKFSNYASKTGLTINYTSIIVSTSAGGSGTVDHNNTLNRDVANAHPIDSITDLRTTLEGMGMSGGLTLGYYYRASDSTSEVGITYIGFSSTGTSTDSELWNIKRFDEDTELQTIASGAWDDRLILTYS